MASTEGRRIVGVAALALAFSLAPRAMAAPDDAESRARALFDQGDALENKGNFAEACPLFQAAHELHATGGTAYRTADCYEKTAQYERALTLYIWVVEHGDSDPHPERVQLCQRRVDALKKQLAKPVVVQPPAPQPTGPIVVVQPPPNNPPPVIVERVNRVPAIVALSIGGVGFVVMGVAGGLALVAASNVKSDCGSMSPCFSSQALLDRSDMSTKAGIANGGLIVGSLGVAVGVVLLIARAPKAQIQAVGPKGLTLSF